MSKDQLPTQKGTELFPQTTKAPTKVRFQGVPPGSQEAQQLVQRYAPQINHFHRSQAQKYSLSTVENYRAHGRYPGLKMTYTNLQGQEIIDVRVETVLSRPGEQKKPGLPWDWVQVDLHVPNVTEEIYGSFSAHVVAPVLDPGDPNIGRADNSGSYHDFTDKPVIQYAYSNKYAYIETTTAPDGTQIASLLVDVRELHIYKEVRIELYGSLPDPGGEWNETADIIGSFTAGRARINLEDGTSSFTSRSPLLLADWVAVHPEVADYTTFSLDSAGPFNQMQDTIDNVLAGSSGEWAMGGLVGNSAGTMFNGLLYWDAGLPPPGYLSSGNAAFAASLVSYQPPLHGTHENYPGTQATSKMFFRGGYYATYSGSQDWGPNGIGTGITYGAMPEPPPINGLPSGDGVTKGYARAGRVYEIWYLFPTYDQVFIPNSPVVRQCTIRAAAFRGTPPWAWAEYEITSAFVSYARWETTDKYPAAFPLGTIAEDVVVSSDPERDFLGTISIFQDNGSVIFTPA